MIDPTPCGSSVLRSRRLGQKETRLTRPGVRSAPPGDISHSSRHAITGSKLPPPRDVPRPLHTPPPATPTRTTFQLFYQNTLTSFRCLAFDRSAVVDTPRTLPIIFRLLFCTPFVLLLPRSFYLFQEKGSIS